MSSVENVSQPNFESYADFAQSYQAVEFLTSDVLFDQEKERLRSELVSDPDLIGIDAIESEIRHAMTPGGSQDLESSKRIQHLQSELDALPQETRAHYREVKKQLEWLESRHTRIVEAGGIEANVLMQLVAEAPSLQILEDGTHYVDHTEAKAYLSEKTFIDLSSVTRRADDTNKIHISAGAEHPLEIPLDLLVYAAGFRSWDGAGEVQNVTGLNGQDLYNGQKQPSIDVMREYASWPTEVPPVHEIIIYVQPDGVMLARNGEGDSHRIGAAMLRGQKTIQAHNVTVVPISEYVASPANTPQNSVAA